MIQRLLYLVRFSYLCAAMKHLTPKLLLAGILCLACLATFVATAATIVSGGTSPEALGTVKYVVRYQRGKLDARVATATITWEMSTWNETPALHSTALVKTTPLFKLFLGSDYFAETYFGRKDLSPLYFINPFKNGKYEYFYRQETGLIESTIDEGDGQPAYMTFPFDGRTMDLLSLLHFVRFLDPSKAGSPYDIQLLMASKCHPARIEYQGIDNDKFPGIPTEKFLVKMTERGLMENGSGDELHIWRSPGPDRRLLALETALSSGSMIVRISQD